MSSDVERVEQLGGGRRRKGWGAGGEGEGGGAGVLSERVYGFVSRLYSCLTGRVRPLPLESGKRRLAFVLCFFGLWDYRTYAVRTPYYYS